MASAGFLRSRAIFGRMGRRRFAPPHCRVLVRDQHATASQSSVAVIGVPYNLGQPSAGFDKGPTAARQAGLIGEISKMTKWSIHDCGDVEYDPSGAGDDWVDFTPEGASVPTKNLRLAGELNHKVYQTVKAQLERDDVILTVGGDHSISIGALQAIVEARPDTAVLWVNAHADINTPTTSTTGNLHGMSLAFLLGLCDVNSLPGWEWMRPALKPDRVAYIGLRDVDVPEKKIIRELGISAYSMTELDRFGIGQVMEMAIRAVDPHESRPIHLSFDIDVIDLPQSQMWGRIDRVKGGLSYREVHFMAESLAETGRLSSMDVVELNPLTEVSVDELADNANSLGSGNWNFGGSASARLTVDMCASALGKRII